MTTHLELARSVRAEHIRLLADARRKHRPCAKELKTLQAVTTQELKLCVQASQPSPPQWRYSARGDSNARR